MYDNLKESCISNLESKKHIRKGRYHFICQTNCYSEDNSSEHCSYTYLLKVIALRLYIKSLKKTLVRT